MSDDAMFGFEHSQPKRKFTKTFTSNIHSSQDKVEKKPASTKQTFGKENKVSTYKKRTQDMSKLVEENERLNKEDEGELSDCSMVSLDLPAPKRRQKEMKGKALQDKDSQNRKKRAPPKIFNLLEQLGGKVEDEIAPTSSAISNAEEPTTLNLDPNVTNNSSPLSSPASSVIDNEEIRGLEDYLTNIEPDTSNDECPICREPVTPEEHHEFFKDKVKNTDNNAQFCRQHKKNKILKDKDKYPEMDWDYLPSRIARLRPRLTAIIKDEVEPPSTYRIQHSKRVTTGKNRSIHDKIDDALEEDGHTGYYGDRGYQIMMVTIATILSTEIAEQASWDPIFRSNPANFFIAEVLVPELAICLVKQDFRCDEMEARKWIEESAEFGRVAHPELDDDVVVSEDENDEDDG